MVAYENAFTSRASCAFKIFSHVKIASRGGAVVGALSNIQTHNAAIWRLLKLLLPCVELLMSEAPKSLKPLSDGKSRHLSPKLVHRTMSARLVVPKRSPVALA
jgi:hypothetical protein